MKVSTVLIVLAASILSSEAVFNGQNWDNAPYMARLVYLNAQQAGGQGGGAIISHRHILTNAFVLGNQFTTLNVFIGSTTRANQRQVGVQTRIPHLNYQGNPRLNDIGIIMLNADIVFDRFTQPIALAGVGQNWPYLNEQGAALGFGGFPTQINQPNLQSAFLRIVTPARCTTRHPQHAAAQQFCGEDARLRSDFCADDVGGPLITTVRGNDVLVGISSLHVCHTNPQVASEPSLFTRVSFFRLWITENSGV